MPPRKTIFSNNEYYHIFNRTVGRQTVFIEKRNIQKALEIIDFYRYPTYISLSHFLNSSKEIRKNILETRRGKKPLVELHAFSLMPNHHHFVLQQIKDNGISTFISNFQNSFAKFFNFKFKRHGTLFTNPFKAVRIETEEQFLHVTRYVHLNHVTAFLVDIEDLANEPRTSFGTYVGKCRYEFVETADVMEYFKKPEAYRSFVFDQVDYQKKLKELEDFLLE